MALVDRNTNIDSVHLIKWMMHYSRCFDFLTKWHCMRLCQLFWSSFFSPKVLWHHWPVSWNFYMTSRYRTFFFQIQTIWESAYYHVISNGVKNLTCEETLPRLWYSGSKVVYHQFKKIISIFANTVKPEYKDHLFVKTTILDSLGGNLCYQTCL